MGIAAAISVGSTFRRRNKERKGTTPPREGALYIRPEAQPCRAGDGLGNRFSLPPRFSFLLSTELRKGAVVNRPRSSGPL